MNTNQLPRGPERVLRVRADGGPDRGVHPLPDPAHDLRSQAPDMGADHRPPQTGAGRMKHHFTIWQCRDWCCEIRPFGSKWWNVGVAPGNYHTVPSWRAAMRVVASGKLPWS